MEIPGSGAQIQVPGAQHEAYVGEVQKSKKPEKFRGPKSLRQLRFRQGFERFSGPGPNFRKIGEKKDKFADFADSRIRGNGVTASSTNPGNRAHAFRITVVDKH